MLKMTVAKKYKGKIEIGEVGLIETKDNLVLPCGVYGRFEGK